MLSNIEQASPLGFPGVWFVEQVHKTFGVNVPPIYMWYAVSHRVILSGLVFVSRSCTATQRDYIVCWGDCLLLLYCFPPNCRTINLREDGKKRPLFDTEILLSLSTVEAHVMNCMYRLCDFCIRLMHEGGVSLLFPKVRVVLHPKLLHCCEVFIVMHWFVRLSSSAQKWTETYVQK